MWSSPGQSLRCTRSPTTRRLQTTVPLHDGRKITGLDIQRVYAEAAAEYVADQLGDDVDEQTADVLHRWIDVLDRLAVDPMDLADELDWPAKLRLLEGFRQRDGLGWAAPRLAMVDLQYSDVRMDKGLYNRLVSRGSMKRLVSEPEVTAAITHPPDDTRAYFRGQCVSPLCRPAGRGVLGFGDLRRRPGLAGAYPDAGADPRHQGARRGTAGQRDDAIQLVEVLTRR